MHKSLLAGILVAALALSGCTAADDKDPSDLYPDEPTGAGTEDLDGEHATPRADEEQEDEQAEGDDQIENTPPTATLSASIQTGEIPFTVTFSLSGADADGDPLMWHLDADGDGTADAEGDALPATYEHEYTEERLYTVLFTVTDGTDTAEASLIINATAVANLPPGQTVLVGSAMSGSTPIADLLGAMQCGGFIAGENGVDCIWFELPPELEGLPYTISSSSSADSNNFIDFLDACDPTGTSLGVSTAASGTVPSGAGCAVAMFFGLAPDGVDFEIIIG